MIRQNADAIANSIVLEQGKTIAGLSSLLLRYSSCIDYHFTDAHGDLLRGLQVVETAAGITSTLLGDKIEGSYNFSLKFGLTLISNDS